MVIAGLATSTALQAGPVYVATVDEAGTVGRGSNVLDLATVSSIATTNANVATNTSNIAALQTLTSSNTARIDSLFDIVDDQDRRIDRANEGVAMALAMESPMLPGGTSFALSGGVGYYDDRGAGTVAMSARVGENAALSAGVGVGFDSGEVGARGGFQIAW